MSTTQSRERLVLAAKQLWVDWQALAETWRDENCRQFEQRYIQTLEVHVREAVMAMDRAEATLNGVQRDLSEAQT